MDPKFPGHNLTFLDSARALKKNPNMKIQPDCDLDEGNPKRCKEKGCLTGFKSDTGGKRHLAIIHGKAGMALNYFV